MWEMKEEWRAGLLFLVALPLVFLEVFGLLEDLFVDLVAVDGGIAVIGQQDNQISFYRR